MPYQEGTINNERFGKFSRVFGTISAIIVVILALTLLISVDRPESTKTDPLYVDLSDGSIYIKYLNR